MDDATLATLIGMAATRCDAAQGQHAAALRAHLQAGASLQTLRDYTKEYDERARPRPGAARDPSADRNQEVFVGRLGAAVAAQERELAQRERALDAAAATLAQARQRLKSLEALAARRRSEARQRAARRDQKLTDEFAQRAHERARQTESSNAPIAEGHAP